jgi:hypothetical protein
MALGMPRALLRRCRRPAPASRRRAASSAAAAPAARKRVLSGIQPTGELHLGNYFGALRTWVAHQADYDNYFCVVDLHALTTPAGHDPKALATQTRQTVATYVACGIDPQVTPLQPPPLPLLLLLPPPLCTLATVRLTLPFHRRFFVMAYLA